LPPQRAHSELLRKRLLGRRDAFALHNVSDFAAHMRAGVPDTQLAKVG
jgi:hypothetical protein